MQLVIIKMAKYGILYHRFQVCPTDPLREDTVPNGPRIVTTLDSLGNLKNNLVHFPNSLHIWGSLQSSAATASRTPTMASYTSPL